MGTRLPGQETPDMAEVAQQENPAPAVPVDVVGPVRVQLLPRQSAAVRDTTVTDAQAVRVLNADMTRARAVLRADEDVYVAFTSAQCDSAQGLLPAGSPPLEFCTNGEVWVKAVTTDARVVVWSEYWTA